MVDHSIMLDHDLFIYDFLVLSNMVSFSSQILLLRLCILLKQGTSPDIILLSLLFLLFLYVFSFNIFVLCYGDLVEVEPSHLTI